MTDPITTDDLDLPDTLHDPDSGEIWHLDRVSVEVEVRVQNPNQHETPGDAEPATYPLATLRSKLEYGDLVETPPETDEELDEDADHECAHCGATFDSQQGLAGHSPCPEAATDSAGE